MRRYILDTGILVHYARGSALYKQIEQDERLTAPDCIIMVSVATVGEILSFGIQNNWGQHKLQTIQTLLSKLIVIDISSVDVDLMNAYATIDAYSKNKLPGNSFGSSVTMGKNDLWIAATAKVANATLLTIDSDFDHLNNSFIQVKKYQQQ